MTAPDAAQTCAKCGQPLLLIVPGRTHCALCKDAFAFAGWVDGSYRLDARDPERLGDLLPDVAADLAARREQPGGAA